MEEMEVQSLFATDSKAWADRSVGPQSELIGPILGGPRIEENPGMKLSALVTARFLKS